MSPELGFALLVTLLWGPTALWLVVRTERGRRRRLPDAFGATSEPAPSSQLAPDAPDTLLGPGFWACGTCRSLNRREANRCYHCRAARSSTGETAPGHAAAGPGIPVMADGLARPPGDAAAGPGIPVMADGLARPPGDADLTAVAVATTTRSSLPLQDLAGAPGDARAALRPGAPVGLPACPFLGLGADPSTRYDFPDPANLCHATSGRLAPRPVPAGKAGTRRPRPVEIEHQRLRCLTATHEQCARFPAAEIIATQ